MVEGFQIKIFFNKESFIMYFKIQGVYRVHIFLRNRFYIQFLCMLSDRMLSSKERIVIFCALREWIHKHVYEVLTSIKFSFSAAYSKL